MQSIHSYEYRNHSQCETKQTNEKQNSAATPFTVSKQHAYIHMNGEKTTTTITNDGRETISHVYSFSCLNIQVLLMMCVCVFVRAQKKRCCYSEVSKGIATEPAAITTTTTAAKRSQ